MSNQQIIIILAGVLLIAVVVLFAALLLDRQKRRVAAIKTVHSSKGNDLWFHLYNALARFTPTRRYILRIRKRIEMLELSDNWTISRKTAQFSFISMGLSLLMFVVLALMDINLFYFIVAAITIIFVHNQIIAMLVDGIENKLMLQFEKFLGDVRHHYHEHGMIDEAIYDTIVDCKYEMSLHAHRMYEVLTSSEPENEIEKYNDIAPNKFFRTFLANCYTVQKFGDKIIDDESMFLSNLNYLKQEISLEMLRRQKLDYLFNSLSIISIVPIFTLKPIEKWGSFNLPEMALYYKGAYGFVVQIALFLLVILSYQMINVLQRDYEHRAVDSGIYDKILKLPPVMRFIGTLKNKEYSRSLRYAELMKVAGIRQSVEQFYLKRIMCLLLGFLACFLLFVNIHGITRNNILNSSDSLISQMKDVDKEAEQAVISLDRKYILKYRNKNVTFQDIEQDLIGSRDIEDKKLADIAAKRILDKVNKYRECYFKWWELLLCAVVSIGFYHIPYWLMVFRKKVMQMNMEDEVMQFHTIILMLMYIERISVEDILQWMEQFALIFKDSVGKCLNNFENGDAEALEQLKLDEPFVPFARIVENLQSASDKIPIARAFDQLKIERGFYQDKRKQDNEITVNRKGMWGKMIAFVPLGAVVLLYLLLPFIMISMTQFLSYSDQMKGVF